MMMILSVILQTPGEEIFKFLHQEVMFSFIIWR